MLMKILIADDEAGMRLVLRKAIEKNDGFEIVGEAEDGITALSLVELKRPQIIFMDVEMPGLTGIECARKVLDINPRTMIIFATAHEEYMPEAFELYAFDYMIKPFKIERINQTLARIRNLDHEQEASLVSRTIRYEKGMDKLIIRNKDGISFVDMKEIILVQREERSTVIYTANGRYVTSDGLSELEERLDRDVFLRCHKSYIINLTMVYKISPYGRWTYIVKLKNTVKDALMTHDKYEELEMLFR